MKNTDWSPIVKAILAAKPPRGKAVYTLEIIKEKTGINIYTLSRLSTQPGRKLEYDCGLKLMRLYKYLKGTGRLNN